MLFNLLTEGAGAGSGTTQPDGNTGSIIMMIVLIVAIVGLFIWQSVSGKKKQKEAQAMVNSLKIGDKVKTIGGICGYVVEINNDENTFVLETGMEKGEKSYVKFDKGAIYQTAPASSSAPASEPAKAKEEEKPQEEKNSEK